MLNKIILASKSKVRKEILDKHNIFCDVKPSHVDEDVVKKSLINESASPEIISKNLAELKANKVSLSQKDLIVLGADSVIDLDGELISKPESREEALIILKKLNGKKHNLISSALQTQGSCSDATSAALAATLMREREDEEQAENQKTPKIIQQRRRRQK